MWGKEGVSLILFCSVLSQDLTIFGAKKRERERDLASGVVVAQRQQQPQLSLRVADTVPQTGMSSTLLCDCASTQGIFFVDTLRCCLGVHKSVHKSVERRGGREASLTKTVNDHFSLSLSNSFSSSLKIESNGMSLIFSGLSLVQQEPKCCPVRASPTRMQESKSLQLLSGSHLFMRTDTLPSCESKRRTREELLCSSLTLFFFSLSLFVWSLLMYPASFFFSFTRNEADTRQQLSWQESRKSQTRQGLTLVVNSVSLSLSLSPLCFDQRWLWLHFEYKFVG